MSVGSIGGGNWPPYTSLRPPSGSPPARVEADEDQKCGCANTAESESTPTGKIEEKGPLAESESAGEDSFKKPDETESASNPYSDLTLEEKKQVQELQSRDREVRAHEQAHVAAGGQYVQGGAHFEYTSGPDNRQYATGGEVSIDTGPVPNDPEATIEKARTIKRAALAPAQPSVQDRQVASRAAKMETDARVELAAQKRDEAENASDQTRSKEGIPGDRNPYIEDQYGRSRSPPTAATGIKRLNIYA